MAGKRVVNTQMTGNVPSLKGDSGGTYDRNTAPFGKPHDTGNGGIPLKFFEDMGEKPAGTTPKPGQVGAPTSAEPREGTKQYPFGKE